MSSIMRRTIVPVIASSCLLSSVLASEALAESSSAIASTPLAYIGPGAGLGALGALLAVLGAIVLCVAGIVLYPLQLLRNRLQGRTEAKESSEAQ